MENLINPLIGSFMGMIGDQVSNSQNAQQQNAYYQNTLNANVNASKKLTRFNNEEAYKMWLKTGAKAQRKMLEEAGLSSALMYKGSGAGGQATASTQSVSGTNPTVQTGGSQQGMFMGLNAMIAESQIKVNEATAKKLEAEATKTAGVDTKLTETQTSSLLQGINNQKATEELTKIQARISTLDEVIKNDTLEESINYVKGLTNYQTEQIKSLGYQNAIDRKTVNEKIELVKLEVTEKVLNNQLIQLKGKEIENSIKQNWEKVKQGWYNVDSQQRQILINEFKANLDSEYQGTGNVIGKIINDLIGTDLPENNKELHRRVDTRKGAGGNW